MNVPSFASTDEADQWLVEHREWLATLSGLDVTQEEINQRAREILESAYSDQDSTDCRVNYLLRSAVITEISQGQKIRMDWASGARLTIDNA